MHRNGRVPARDGKGAVAAADRRLTSSLIRFSYAAAIAIPMRRSRLGTPEPRHAREQRLDACASIRRVVQSAVTVRADSDGVVGHIRSVVGELLNVMHFEKPLAAVDREGPGLPA